MQTLIMRLYAAQAVIASQAADEAIQTAQLILTEPQTVQAAKAEFQVVCMAIAKMLAVQGQALAQLQMVMQQNKRGLRSCGQVEKTIHNTPD